MASLVLPPVTAPMVKYNIRSLLQTTPWVAIASLVGMVACAVASAILVAVSHDDVVSFWKVQPPVLLAILSAVSNIAFNTALATGIAVRFWLSASSGSVLSQLHYIWDHGRGLGLIPALRAGSEARKVALIATFAYVTQFLSGPLLQRSIEQTRQDRTSTEPMSLDLVSYIHDGWWGYRGTAEDDGLVGSRNMIPEIQQWWRNTTMLTHNETGYVCDGTCHGYVRGAGFNHLCSSTVRHLDVATAVTNDEMVFVINATVVPDATGQPVLRLRFDYISEVSDSCVATIAVEICDIDAGVVEYPVTIQDVAVSLRYDELPSMTVDSTYVATGDLFNATATTGAGPLYGLLQFIYTGARLNDNATKNYHPEMNRAFYAGTGLLEDLFFMYDAFPNTTTDGDAPTAGCRLKWSSPTQYVLEVMHEFMFRTAFVLGNRTETQSFAAHRTVSVMVFRVDALYLALGLAAMTGGILLVGSLMWGWWRLKRPVTLSPLETAPVLRGAILHDVPPDATIKQVLTRATTLEIRAAS